MTASAPPAARRRRLPGRFALVAATVLVLLHALPWWVLVLAPGWPTWLFRLGTGLTVIVLIGFPVAMVRGHGRRGSDPWAIARGHLARPDLGAVHLVGDRRAGRPGAGRGRRAPTPDRPRMVAVAVLVVVLVLAPGGTVEARRVPRSGARRSLWTGWVPALDGMRIVLHRGHPLRPDRPGPLVGPDGGRGEPAGRRTWSRTPAISPTARSSGAAPRSRHSAPCGPSWPGSTSPATTSTTPAPGMGRAHGRAGLDRAAQPARRASSAAAPGWRSPAWTT